MVRQGEICVLLLVAALLCPGCGPTVEPIEVASGCPGQPVRGPMVYDSEPANLLIDSFESHSKLLIPVGGRDGAWVLGTDFTSVALVDEPSSKCAASGLWAGHFAARGFTSWGVNWTAVFRATTGSNVPVPFDGSAYSGISFWAAFGGENGPAFDIPVGISTMDTAYNSSICSPCNDHYMTKVRLSGNWQRFFVRFDQMAQSGSGNPQVALRKDQLVGFIIYPRQQFDIWIDDVRFETQP